MLLLCKKYNNSHWWVVRICGCFYSDQIFGILVFGTNSYYKIPSNCFITKFLCFCSRAEFHLSAPYLLVKELVTVLVGKQFQELLLCWAVRGFICEDRTNTKAFFLLFFSSISFMSTLLQPLRFTAAQNIWQHRPTWASHLTAATVRKRKTEGTWEYSVPPQAQQRAVLRADRQYAWPGVWLWSNVS